PTGTTAALYLGRPASPLSDDLEESLGIGLRLRELDLPGRQSAAEGVFQDRLKLLERLSRVPHVQAVVDAEDEPRGVELQPPGEDLLVLQPMGQAQRIADDLPHALGEPTRQRL